MTADVDPSWSGPVERPTSLRPVLTGVLVVLLVAACLVAVANRHRQLLVVGTGLVVALVVRAWPRAVPRPGWRIDAAGVTTHEPHGSTSHVPASAYDGLAVAADTAPRRDRLVLVRVAAPHDTVHTVPLDRVGTAFTACFALRRVGLQVLVPPAGAAAVAAGEQRLRDALDRPRPVPSTPVPAALAPAMPVPEVLTDRPPAATVRAVVVRVLVGALGLVLVAGLAEPVGATGTGRSAAALGVLLAVTALPRLARGRLVRASLRWRVGPDLVEVADADRGTWRWPTAQLGAVVLTTSEAGGHGAREQTSALMVGRDGAPLTELPLRSIDPADLVEALHRHGVPVVHAGVQAWEVRGGLSPPG